MVVKILLVLLLFYLVVLIYLCYDIDRNLYIHETFDIQFGTPQESSDENKTHIKGLLEIGSQAQENTKYDKVSTQYLGNINVKNTSDKSDTTMEKPDPVCFKEDITSQINNIFSLLN